MRLSAVIDVEVLQSIDRKPELKLCVSVALVKGNKDPLVLLAAQQVVGVQWLRAAVRQQVIWKRAGRR